MVHVKPSNSNARFLPEEDPGTKAPLEKDSFPVVAVGASAGGLEAFTKLLHSLPNNTGMAFVFIQHLDPTHSSLLPELLSKASSLPVVSAKHGTRVLPNSVYVMPPNVGMSIQKRHLRLTPRVEHNGLHLPIDGFMRSLAEDAKEWSIGVILSGTGSDGTRGLGAIKQSGGITLVEAEESAKYDGMPHSAIVAGHADFILSPEGIGRELARIGGHPYLRGALTQPKPELPARQPEGADGSFDKIYRLMRRTNGLDFRQYKPGTMQRRTLRRMAIHKIEHVGQYADYLEKHSSESEKLFQDLLIPVTSFFRDLEAFEFLKAKVYPSIVANKSNDSTIRIWAPGCSTGEETYSLAMTLLEFLGEKASWFQIQLFGTDVNGRGIESARAGVYKEEISDEVSPERLRRFFVKIDGGGYKVSKSLRDLCIFAKHNLAQDPPFSQMNLVACRNLMIYLGSDLHRKIVPLLHYALKDSGFLMLGNAENLATHGHLFKVIDKKHKIFSKKPLSVRPRYDIATNRPARPEFVTAASKPREPARRLEQRSDADNLILRKYAPPGVVINASLEILQFRGETGPYVEPVPGRATLHLLRIARRDLATELRTAVDQARKSGAAVKRTGIRIRRLGHLRSLTISVEPLNPGSAIDDRQYLVLFQETAKEAVARGRVTGKPSRDRLGRGQIAALTGKLAATEEHLNSLIESKEATDEEFQSANEEVLSANEELQSTNEELETSKEELQSANQELTTLNDELHNRNAQLDQANNDLSNLLASSALPVIMLDRGLRIRLLTSASAQKLKVLPSDIGRPISEISFAVEVPHLEELISSVIDTLAPRELDVQDAQGHWYSLQIRPYRTADDRIDGAVMVLADIDARKKATEHLAKSEELLDDIVRTVREPLVVLDADLRVLYANSSFYDTFGVSARETEEKFLYRLGAGEWNTPELIANLTEVISKDSSLQDYEMTGDFPGIGKGTMLLNARRIDDVHRNQAMMLLAMENITIRKRAEEVIARSRVELELLVANRTSAVRKLSANLLASQDNERRRIARELHDSLGQYLSYAKMTLGSMKKPETETDSQLFAQLAVTLDNCLTETRTLSHLLHPPLIEELGFSSAAKWYVEGFSERSGINVNCNIPDDLKRLSAAVEITLFRILQESLTNVHRHSQSSSVDIQVSLNSKEINLVVSDRGQGVPQHKLDTFLAGKASGLGLTSMRERASELDGHFRIESTDHGTIIRVTLPLSETGEPAAQRQETT